MCAQIPLLFAQSDLAEVLTIQANSDIGQPLQAQINVGSLPSLQGDISISLASQRAFETRDFFLELDVQGVGARQSTVASSEPVLLDRVPGSLFQAGLLCKAKVVARAEVQV